MNAFPAPNLTAECPNGSSRSIDDLRGRFVRLVVTGTGATPPTARRADVVMLVVPLEASEEAAGACTVRDPDAVKALAIYRGVDPSAMAGTEFLIDPDGRLRAMWYPGRAEDWNDPAGFAQEIERLRSTPAIGRPAHPRGHMH